MHSSPRCAAHPLGLLWTLCHTQSPVMRSDRNESLIVCKGRLKAEVSWLQGWLMRWEQGPFKTHAAAMHLMKLESAVCRRHS